MELRCPGGRAGTAGYSDFGSDFSGFRLFVKSTVPLWLNGIFLSTPLST
jgi:hypothetical protein